MTGIRNGVLGRVVTTATGFTLVGTVPAGMTWLLKAVHLVNNAAATANLVVQLTSPDNSIAAQLPHYAIDPTEAVLWQGWTSLGPGDHLYVSSDQVGVHIWAAGAELPGTI